MYPKEKKTDVGLGCEYGPPGSGKTLALLRAFPGAVFIAMPGALEGVWQRFTGCQPKTVDTYSHKDTISYLKNEKFTHIVLDDFTLITDRNVREWSKKDQKAWGENLDQTLRIIDVARDRGVWLWMNCHVSEPKPGVVAGPMLPGQAAGKVAASVDISLRVVPHKGRVGWPHGFECNDANPLYNTKSRKGFIPSLAPMNLGEILRSIGYDLPRAPGMEWAESVVEKLSEDVSTLAAPARKERLSGYVDKLRTKYAATDPQIAWVFEDALDRAELKTHDDSVLKAFIS